MNLPRIGGLFALPVAVLISNGAAFAQAPTAVMDVVGIKLGMSMADAVAAIEADNPKLSVQTQTMVLEGFEQPFATAIVASQPTESGKDGEEITLLLTTPPSHQVVWGGASSVPTTTAPRACRHWTTRWRGCAGSTVQKMHLSW